MSILIRHKLDRAASVWHCSSERSIFNCHINCDSVMDLIMNALERQTGPRAKDQQTVCSCLGSTRKYICTASTLLHPATVFKFHLNSLNQFFFYFSLRSINYIFRNQGKNIEKVRSHKVKNSPGSAPTCYQLYLNPSLQFGGDPSEGFCVLLLTDEHTNADVNITSLAEVGKQKKRNNTTQRVEQTFCVANIDFESLYLQSAPQKMYWADAQFVQGLVCTWCTHKALCVLDVPAGTRLTFMFLTHTAQQHTKKRQLQVEGHGLYSVWRGIVGCRHYENIKTEI